MLSQPWHMLHPCCTADVLTAVLGLQALDLGTFDSKELQLCNSDHGLQGELRGKSQLDINTCSVPPAFPTPSQAPQIYEEEKDVPDIDDLLAEQQGRERLAIPRLMHGIRQSGAGTQLHQPGQRFNASVGAAAQSFARDMEMPGGAGAGALLQYMQAWWGLVGRVLL